MNLLRSVVSSIWTFICDRQQSIYSCHCEIVTTLNTIFHCIKYVKTQLGATIWNSCRSNKTWVKQNLYFSNCDRIHVCSSASQQCKYSPDTFFERCNLFIECVNNRWKYVRMLCDESVGEQMREPTAFLSYLCIWNLRACLPKVGNNIAQSNIFEIDWMRTRSAFPLWLIFS